MKIKFILIVTLGLFINQVVFGQGNVLPKWIDGSWVNSDESNTFKLVFLTFKNDSIFIGKGFSGIEKNNQINLNEKYSTYKTSNSTKNNTFKIKFEKTNDVIIYEFKLQDVNYSNKPVLTYSLSINGNLKRKHSTSCNAVFEKINEK